MHPKQVRVLSSMVRKQVMSGAVWKRLNISAFWILFAPIDFHKSNQKGTTSSPDRQYIYPDISSQDVGNFSRKFEHIC